MRIVDLHHYRGEAIYCGRPMPSRKGSPLGNPFKPKDGDAIGKYRAWLAARIEHWNAEVMEAMQSITGDSILACWCVDLEGEAIFTESEQCHCQVIWKAWRYLGI